MKESSAVSRIKANLQELFKAKLAPGDAYIRFQLTSDLTALLSMKQVQEALVVEADRITSLPCMPESVIGIISSRDRVFCVFDLAQLLQLTSQLIAPRQYQIIVLEVSTIISAQQNLYLGLAISRIQGITRLTSEKFQSPQNLPTSLTPYVCGCSWENEQQLIVLEPQAIAKTISLSKNR